MISKNTTINIFKYLALFLAVFAITGFNFNNATFGENKKEYIMFGGFVVCIIIYLVLLNKQKNLF